MNDETDNLLRKLTHEHLHLIWQFAKENQLDNLSLEDKQLAQIMLDHEDEFYNQFEFADVTYDYGYDAGTGVNPFLHIVIHSIVENQLRIKDPIEAYQFYNAMLNKKVTRHDTIHLIGSILTPLIFYSLKQRTMFDTDLYGRLLRNYMHKKPDKISSAVAKDLNDLFSTEN